MAASGDVRGQEVIINVELDKGTHILVPLVQANVEHLVGRAPHIICLTREHSYVL